MATYATAADDVVPKLGNRPLTTTSDPSLSEVEDWLVQLEAELIGTLEAVGVSESSFSSRGLDTLRGWVASAGAGLVREAHAAAAGAGNNEDGRADVKAWTDRLADIAARPSFFRQLLCGASATGAASMLRGGPSGTAAREPWFTTDEKW